MLHAQSTRKMQAGRLMFGLATPGGEDCDVTISFDFNQGHRWLLVWLERLIHGPVGDIHGDRLVHERLWRELATREAFPGSVPVIELVIQRLPFGPHWPVAPEAFCEGRGGVPGVSAEQSRKVVQTLTRAGFLNADATPNQGFLLSPDIPLPIDGLDRNQVAGIRARLLGHARPCGSAELSPEGVLFIHADVFVLSTLRDALARGMGRDPVLGTQERLRILPDPRFFFAQRRRRDGNHTLVTSLELTGFHTDRTDPVDEFLHVYDVDGEVCINV